MLRPEYVKAVNKAGGTAIILPHTKEDIPSQLALCHGFILTGGDDPDMRAYGESNHPSTKTMDPQRQVYEEALIDALKQTRHPVLGICLGMQLMALRNGGKLTQHLDEKSLLVHSGQKEHIVKTTPDAPFPSDGASVLSSHHQALNTSGALAIWARGPHDIIEGVCAPEMLKKGWQAASCRFYLGVQWHPERTQDRNLGLGLFEALVAAATRFSEGPESILT